MSQLVGMCSGVFESQTDESGAVEREGSGDTVKQASDSEDNDVNDSASKPIEEEDEDLNAHGFVVEEAEVSGDSDEEDEDDAKGGDIDDLLADEDEDLSDDASDAPAFVDDGDDDEIARLKKRFVHEADEDELADASEQRQKKAKADQTTKANKAEARRLRKEKKKARREARRQKRLAKEAAEEGDGEDGEDGEDGKAGVDAETEKNLDNLFAAQSDEPESSEDDEHMSKLEDDFKKRAFWESEQKADSEAQMLAFNEDTSHVSNMIRNTYSNSMSMPFGGVRRGSSVGEDSMGSNSRRSSAVSRSGSGTGEGVQTSRGFAGLLASNSPTKKPLGIVRRNSWLQKTGKDKDRLLACTAGGRKKIGKNKSGGGSKGYVFSVQDEGSQSVNLFDSGSDSQAGGMATSSRKRALGSAAQNKFNTGALKRSKSSDASSAAEPKENRFAKKSSSLFKAFAKKPVSLAKSR